MLIYKFRSFLIIFTSTLLFSVSLSAQKSAQGLSKIRVKVDRVERISSNEARFQLTIANNSIKPVFLEGDSRQIHEGGPLGNEILEGLYLEQWRHEQGWRVVIPCRDMFSSEPIRVNPGGSIAQEWTLQPPLPSVCRVRDIHFDGKFRFRVDYFESGKAVKTYIEKMNSPGSVPPPSFSASESFEIPPFRK